MAFTEKTFSNLPARES